MAKSAPLRFLTAPLALILLAAGPAAADRASFEQTGLEREARLDYDGAFDAYRDALEAAVVEAHNLDRDLAFADAEVYVLKLAFLAEKTARFPDLGATLARVRASRIPPLLDARCAWFLARAALASGDLSGAEEIVGGLGFLARFAVAGPFDNERGGGFSTAYEPERGPIDLSARYRGKGREIGWRVPEPDAFLAKVDLDAMLRPNDEALAYALTYVKWEDEPRPAALRVGSDEGLKAWWNGTLVLSRDLNRTLEPDQDAVPIVLRRGWNRLLLKVTERKGEWGFMARITDPDGTPLAKRLAVEPRVALADAQVEAPPAEEEAGPAILNGAIDAYEALEKSGKATARDFFHLGYLHYRRKAHDENAHPDREAFKRAVALDERNPFYHAYLSFVSGTTGEFSVNREENARRAELERTLELDPKQARAALLLADYYVRSLGIVEKAEGYVDRALAIAPASVEARLLKAELCERQGLEGYARALVAKLSEEPAARRSPAALARLAAARRIMGDLGGAEEALVAALALDHTDAAIRADLVETRKARGDVDGALAALADRVRFEPCSVAPRLERARLLAGEDRLPEAAEEAEQALGLAPDDDGALAEHGRILLRMGKREAALEDFGHALRLNPNLVDLRRYVEFLKDEENPFEAEHRLDPAEAIAAAKKIPLDPAVPARTLLENVVSKVNLDGTSSEYDQEVFRIENDDGVERYDRYAVAYAAGEQKARIERATVLKKDGRREEARIDNDSPGPSDSEFATYAQRSVDLPRLEVGDIAIVEYRIDDLKQSFFGDYFGHTHYFQGFAPVERSRYTLIAPAGRQFYFHPRLLDVKPEKRVSPDGSTVTTVFEKRGMPRIEQEPNMPDFEEVAPAIQVSTFEDWNAFARWYWNLVHKQQELSDEMRAKVSDLTAGKKTREEKIRAIYDFVVTDVRYNDKWEFGVHGFKPYNAASIFARRFGDCKDKATLLITMLSALGTEAYPVLIDGESERSEEDLTLPLMTHFNHCIAYVPGPAPGGGDGWFLDGTAQFHEVMNLPNMDFGATVVIVKPDGAEMKRIKWPDPLRENGIKEWHRVALRPDGGATISTELEPAGIYSVVLREQFENPAKRKETLEKIYGRHFAGATILEENFGDLKDIDEPVRVRFRLDVPKFVKDAAGGQALEEVPSVLFERLFAEDLSDLATKAERKYDVILPVPSGVEERIEYALPDAAVLRRTPPETVLENEFGTYVKRYEVQGNVLRVTRRLVVKAQRIPAERYQAWREFANQIDRADEERALLGGGGPRQ